MSTASGTSGDHTGDHATAGFTGGGATAFPAQQLGKDLHGEHLKDFEQVRTGSLAFENVVNLVLSRLSRGLECACSTALVATVMTRTGKAQQA